METAALTTFAAAILTILNPIGNTAIFGSIVGGRPRSEQRAIAIKCAIAVAIILVGTIWIGEEALRLFGVSIDALEAAGGIMISLIAISMLHAKQSGMHASDPEDRATGDSVAVVPLAMPIVAGPGAIATVMINTHANHGVAGNIEMSVVCVLAAALVGLCFLLTGALTRLLGHAGMDIVTKFMGMILLAIALGMLASGLKGLMPGLGAPAQTITASETPDQTPAKKP